MQKFLICFLMFFEVIHSQNTFKTNNASINFDAGKAVSEPIKAKNSTVRIILDTQTGNIACLMDMTEFKFPNQLMQEHFNENYIESHKYPKSTFVGVIENFTTSNFLTPKVLNMHGEFSIHGKKQQRTIPITIEFVNNTYQISSNFTLNLKDYQIKIPKVVFYKFAEKVKVNTKAILIQ